MGKKQDIVNGLGTVTNNIRIQADMLSRACYGFWQKYSKALCVHFENDGRELSGAVSDAGHLFKDEMLATIENIKDWVNVYGDEYDEYEEEDLPSIELFESYVSLLESQVTALSGSFYGLLFDAKGWMKGVDKADYYTPHALAVLRALDRLTRELAFSIQELSAPALVRHAQELIAAAKDESDAPKEEAVD